MPPASATPAPTRSLVILGLIVLTAATLFWAQTVLIPIFMAILLSFALNPVVGWVQRRGLSRAPAVTLTALCTALLVGGLLWAVAVQLRSLAERLPDYRANISEKIRSLRAGGPGVVENLRRAAEDIDRDLESGSGADGAPAKPLPVVVRPSGSAGLALFPQIALPTIHFLGSVSLVVGLAVSMLLKREDLRNRLLRLMGHGRLPGTTRAIDDATRRISRYLLVQAALSIGFGVVFGVGLALIDVPYSVLWGVLASLLRLIPYIGTWLAAVCPLALSVAAFPGWLEPVLVVALVLALGLSTNNLIEPMLVSRSTGVSPIALVIAAAFWTWLWGWIGLVLSTPITVCLGVLGQRVPHLEFFEVLLGTEPALDPHLGYYQRLLARDEDEATDLVEEYSRTHTAEETFEDVLVPALLLAGEDRERGDLAPEDERYVTQTTGRILAEVLPPPATPEGEGTKPAVLCCPARDEEDELALRMFGRLLAADGFRAEVASSKEVSSEMVERVRREAPAVVFVASLPPGGLAQTRYLCKRLRAQFPTLPVVVARWGLPEEGRERVVEQLLAAGATRVTGSFAASRQEVLPLLRLSAPAPADANGPATNLPAAATGG